MRLFGNGVYFVLIALVINAEAHGFPRSCAGNHVRFELKPQEMHSGGLRFAGAIEILVRDSEHARKLGVQRLLDEAS